MTRDILDYLGNVIGVLELPDDTSEEVWTDKLAKYAVAPVTTEENALLLIEYTVRQRKEIADDLLTKWKKENILVGINGLQAMWAHHRMRALPVTFMGVSFTLDLLNLAVSGDLEVAQLALMNTEPDDMSLPYHFISQEKIDGWVADLSEKTGMPS